MIHCTKLGCCKIDFTHWLKKTRSWKDNSSIIIWTDSLVNYYRLTQSPNKAPRGLAVRLMKTREDLTFSMGYIEGSNNPADLISRGCKLKYWMDSTLWRHGPDLSSSNSKNEVASLCSVVKSIPESFALVDFLFQGGNGNLWLNRAALLRKVMLAWIHKPVDFTINFKFT